MRMLLKGAKVFRKDCFNRLDLMIEGTRITAISPFIGPEGVAPDTVVNLDNCFILPGFVDVHVHLREPGFSYKETIAAGTRAAARGGYTAVCTMPNLNPVPDSLEHLETQKKIIKRDAVIDVYPFASITVGQAGKQLVAFETLAPQVAGFSDDGRGVQDRGLMREAMLRVKAAGSLIVAHCEDEALRGNGIIHDGDYARRQGYAGISSASEYVQIERDLELVRDIGCRYHVCHVSTAESVALMAAAKADGLPVTCETAPHYLLLCQDDLRDDGRFKMNPPLRSAADRDALVAALLDGTIDMIATDHAPHAGHEKNRGLRDSLMGIVGLETAFSVLYTRLVAGGVLSLEMLIEKMALAPRRLLGQAAELCEGAPADVCVIDPGAEGVVDPGRFFSKGRSTPFAGWPTQGDLIMTIKGGKTVWRKPTAEK